MTMRLRIAIVALFAASALLSACGGHDWQHEPYDPKHSAADRYGQRSDFVNGSYWADLCAGVGGTWSNLAPGSCQGFLWRDVIHTENGGPPGG